MDGSTVVLRICDGECGGFIPAKRLAAKRNARYCVACQERHDQVLRDAPVNMARLHTLPRDNEGLKEPVIHTADSVFTRLRRSGVLSLTAFSDLRLITSIG